MSRKGCCEACADRRIHTLRSVRVQGRSLRLCERHAQWIADHPDATLTSLAARWGVTLERREREDRRSEPNRRIFPPRPETRRYNFGRRADDPAY